MCQTRAGAGTGKRDRQAAGEHGWIGEPREFSAPGLRAGYLTEAANRSIPLCEAMKQSRHRSSLQLLNNAS